MQKVGKLGGRKFSRENIAYRRCNRNERLRVNRSEINESRESERTNQGMKMRKNDDAFESTKE